MTTDELQKLFGPNVIGMGERKYHYCTGPCLILKNGTSEEEKRVICKKFQEWRHGIFLESIGCKNDEEYHDFIYGKGKFKKI